MGDRTVAEKVDSQHLLLDSLLRSVTRAYEESDADECEANLARLKRSLELHLSLEEKHYFPQNERDQPHLRDGIASLVAEHHALRRALSDVAASDSLAAGRTAFAAFVAFFHRHEKTELALLRS